MRRVAVITPTWGAARHEVLLERCIPSVARQTFTDLEHLVVSDGPDPALSHLLTDSGVRYAEVAEHVEPHSWGASARNLGLTFTGAEYIAYLDSDNAYRPQHLAHLVDALDRNPRADFAYSRMLMVATNVEVGGDPPSLGRIDSSLIVHRREAVEWYGDWPELPVYSIDWELISSWLIKGASWAFVPEVTVDYYSDCRGR